MDLVNRIFEKIKIHQKVLFIILIAILIAFLFILLLGLGVFSYVKVKQVEKLTQEKTALQNRLSETQEVLTSTKSKLSEVSDKIEKIRGSNKTLKKIANNNKKISSKQDEIISVNEDILVYFEKIVDDVRELKRNTLAVMEAIGEDNYSAGRIYARAMDEHQNSLENNFKIIEDKISISKSLQQELENMRNNQDY